MTSSATSIVQISHMFTLAFEQRWNPALTQDKSVFVRDVLANISPRPAGMDRIIAANIAA